MDNQLKEKYGLPTAIGMVVGIVIGSGVFFKAEAVLSKTGGNMPLGKVAITDADVVLDISIVVEYGKKIPEVAGAIQKAVASAVGDMTGLNVVAVNVHVAAVQFVEPAAEEAPAAEQEAAEQA